MTMENNSLERLDPMSIKRTNKDITDALDGRDATGRDLIAALEGRDPVEATRAEQVTAALRGEDPAAAAEASRVTAALRGEDPEGDRRNAQLVDALEGRGSSTSWQDRMDMELAVESYRDALLRKYPASGTLEKEMRRAVEIRDQYMTDHRAQYSTEEALWKATVGFMNSLAAHTVELVEARENGGRSTHVSEAGDPQLKTLRAELARANAAGDRKAADDASKAMRHLHDKALWEQGLLEDASGKTHAVTVREFSPNAIQDPKNQN